VKNLNRKQINFLVYSTVAGNLIRVQIRFPKTADGSHAAVVSWKTKWSFLTVKFHGAEGPTSLQVPSSTFGGGENIKEGGKTAFLFLASRVCDIGDMMLSVGLMYLPGYSHGFFFCCCNGSLTGSGWFPFLPSSLIVGFIILLSCTMSFSIKTGGVLISADGGVVSGVRCPTETSTGEEDTPLSNSLAGVWNWFSIIGKM
jgi:hypothetical protein